MNSFLRFNFLPLICVILINCLATKSNGQLQKYSHLSMAEKENKCLELIEQAENMVEGYLVGYECQAGGEGEIVYKFEVNHWYKGEGPQVINLVHKLDASKDRYTNNRKYNLVPHTNYLLLINQYEDTANYRFSNSDSLMVLGSIRAWEAGCFNASMLYKLRFDSSVAFDDFLKKIQDVQIKSTQNTPKPSNKTDYFFDGKLFKPNVKEPELVSRDDINLLLVEHMEKQIPFKWSEVPEQISYSALVHSEERTISVGYEIESDVIWYDLPSSKKYSVLPCECMEKRDAIIDYVLREESAYKGIDLYFSDIIRYDLQFALPSITFTITDPSIILKLKQHPAVTRVEPYTYGEEEVIMNLWMQRVKNKNKKD